MQEKEKAAGITNTQDERQANRPATPSDNNPSTSQFEREITPEELQAVLAAAASEQPETRRKKARSQAIKIASEEESAGSRYRKNHRNRHHKNSQTLQNANTQMARQTSHTHEQPAPMRSGGITSHRGGQTAKPDSAAQMDASNEQSGSKPGEDGLDTIFEEAAEEKPYIKPMDESGFDPYEGDEFKTPIPGTNPAHLSRTARKNSNGSNAKSDQNPAAAATVMTDVHPSSNLSSSTQTTSQTDESANAHSSFAKSPADSQMAAKPRRPRRKRSWLDYENNRSAGSYGPMDDWIGNPSWADTKTADAPHQARNAADQPIEIDPASKTGQQFLNELKAGADPKSASSTSQADQPARLDVKTQLELDADNNALLHVDEAAAGLIEAEALAGLEPSTSVQAKSTADSSGSAVHTTAAPAASSANSTESPAPSSAHSTQPANSTASRKSRSIRRKNAQPEPLQGQEMTIEELAAAGIDLAQARDLNAPEPKPRRKKKKGKRKSTQTKTGAQATAAALAGAASAASTTQSVHPANLAKTDLPTDTIDGIDRSAESADNQQANAAQDRAQETKPGSRKKRRRSQTKQNEPLVDEEVVEEEIAKADPEAEEAEAIPSWKKLKEAAERAYQKEKEEVERMEADQIAYEKGEAPDSSAPEGPDGPDGDGPDDTGNNEEAPRKVPLKDRARLFLRKALLRPGTYILIIAAIAVLWIVIRMAMLGLFTFSLITLVLGIGIAGLALAGFWFFYTIHKLWRIPAILICIGLVTGSVYAQQDLNLISDTLAKVTEPADSYVQNVGLYAPSLIPVNKLENVNGEKIGIIGGRDETAVHSLLVSMADQGIYVHVKSYDNLQQLYKAVRGQAVRAVILEAGDVRLIQDFSGSQTGEQQLSLVYSMPVDTKVTSPRSDLNMEKDPFTILISGSSDPISDPSYRSNLNLLVTINPSTRQILTTVLPRSLYVTSHCQEALACLAENQPDRLSLVSYHSIEALRETLENVMDTPIQFSVRLNTDKILGLYDQGKAIRFNAGSDYTEVNPETGTVMTGPQVRQYIGSINDLSEENLDQELKQLHALITLAHQNDLLSTTNLKGLMKVIQNSVWTSMDYNQLRTLLRMFFLFPEQMNESYSLVGGASQTLYSPTLTESTFVTLHDQASLDMAKAGIQTVLQGGTPAVSGLPTADILNPAPAAPAADQAATEAAGPAEGTEGQSETNPESDPAAVPETGGDQADQQPADTANAPAVSEESADPEAAQPAATGDQN